MKMIVLASMLLSCIACAREMKPVDRTKPVYQLDWGIMPFGDMWLGGAWSERQFTEDLSPRQRAAIEATANAAMYRRAAYLSWVLVGLCAIATYVLHWKHGIGVALICAGFSFASSFMASTAHYALRIGLCVAAVAVIGFCFTPHGKSLFKARRKEDVNK